jgi:hypothetical protein
MGRLGIDPDSSVLTITQGTTGFNPETAGFGHPSIREQAGERLRRCL